MFFKMQKIKLYNYILILFFTMKRQKFIFHFLSSVQL